MKWEELLSRIRQRYEHVGEFESDYDYYLVVNDLPLIPFPPELPYGEVPVRYRRYLLDKLTRLRATDLGLDDPQSS